MVVDRSALIAIVLDERDAAAAASSIEQAVRPSISAATYVEACIVMVRRYGVAGADRIDQFIERFGVEVDAVTADQAQLARVAFVRFGKGRHRAALNFGDCFSYTLAKQRDEPLPFVGDDFTRTDVRSATA